MQESVWSELGTYIAAVFFHWRTVIAAVLFGLQTVFNVPVLSWPRTRVALLAAFLVWATFAAWQDEHREVVKLRASGADPVAFRKLECRNGILAMNQQRRYLEQDHREQLRQQLPQLLPGFHSVTLMVAQGCDDCPQLAWEFEKLFRELGWAAQRVQSDTLIFGIGLRYPPGAKEAIEKIAPLRRVSGADEDSSLPPDRLTVVVGSRPQASLESCEARP